MENTTFEQAKELEAGIKIEKAKVKEAKEFQKLMEVWKAHDEKTNVSFVFNGSDFMRCSRDEAEEFAALLEIRALKRLEKLETEFKNLK